MSRLRLIVIFLCLMALCACTTRPRVAEISEAPPSLMVKPATLKPLRPQPLPPTTIKRASSGESK